MNEPTCDEIAVEMNRQRELWGEQNHDDVVWLAILTEEVGEAAQATLQGGDVRTEIVQCAAVAASWLEALDRREKDPGSTGG